MRKYLSTVSVVAVIVVAIPLVIAVGQWRAAKERQEAAYQRRLDEWNQQLVRDLGDQAASAFARERLAATQPATTQPATTQPAEASQ